MPLIVKLRRTWENGKDVLETLSQPGFLSRAIRPVESKNRFGESLLSITPLSRISPIAVMRYRRNPSLPIDRVDQVCPIYKSNLCNELLPSTLLRTSCDDYTCVTHKMNCCKEILARPCFDPFVSIMHVSHVSPIAVRRYRHGPVSNRLYRFACVTRTSNDCNEISPLICCRIGCDDCTCVTRKSNTVRR